eukprot:3006335-Amphidinium_carterae.1
MSGLASLRRAELEHRAWKQVAGDKQELVLATCQTSFVRQQPHAWVSGGMGVLTVRVLRATNLINADTGLSAVHAVTSLNLNRFSG